MQESITGKHDHCRYKIWQPDQEGVATSVALERDSLQGIVRPTNTEWNSDAGQGFRSRAVD